MTFEIRFQRLLWNCLTKCNFKSHSKTFHGYPSSNKSNRKMLMKVKPTIVYNHASSKICIFILSSFKTHKSLWYIVYYILILSIVIRSFIFCLLFYLLTNEPVPVTCGHLLNMEPAGPFVVNIFCFLGLSLSDKIIVSWKIT